MQHWDTAAHAGLEQIVHAPLFGQGQQLCALLRHQLLVGGDHVLAGVQGPLRVLVGRLHAADGLHHHPDSMVLLDLREVIRHQLTVGPVLEMPHQNGLHLQGLAQLSLDLPGVFRHYLGHAGAHRTKAHNRNLYHASVSSLFILPGLPPVPRRPRRPRLPSASPGSPPVRWSLRKSSPPRSRWWECSG